MSPGPSAAAIPPCAHFVEPSSTRDLVTINTESPCVLACNAVVSPAIPEPTTITSACAVQPGAGAKSFIVRLQRSSAYCRANGPHLANRK